MKKIKKSIGVILVVAMLATILSVGASAAPFTEVKLISPPTRTDYFLVADEIDGVLYCDPSGIVLEVTTLGRSKTVTPDEAYIDIYVENPQLGANDATIVYRDDILGLKSTVTTPVNVFENPVKSIEITKLPDKTVYDWNEDVLTRENFSIDEYIDENSELLEKIIHNFDPEASLDDIKAAIKEDPKMEKMFLDIIFENGETKFLYDLSGLEFEVTFNDGTTATYTDEDMFGTYKGYEYPIYIQMVEDEADGGANKMCIEFMGAEQYFDFTINNKPAEPEKPAENPTETPTEKTENLKNPEIPNTDGTTVAAVAVIAVMSVCGIALIPSKKEK